VLSFNVRILAVDYQSLVSTPPNPVILTNPTTSTQEFMDVQDANIQYNANVVNTGYNTGGFCVTPSNNWQPPSPPFLIKALEVTIRVWDVKTSQTRQITFVQDM
jgi:hypothetical protein